LGKERSSEDMRLQAVTAKIVRIGETINTEHTGLHDANKLEFDHKSYSTKKNA
jgi:hypothetical protein